MCYTVLLKHYIEYHLKFLESSSKIHMEFTCDISTFPTLLSYELKYLVTVPMTAFNINKYKCVVWNDSPKSSHKSKRWLGLLFINIFCFKSCKILAMGKVSSDSAQVYWGL